MAIPFTADASFKWNQALAFILTFIGYTTYHATRTPYAIVKSSLDTETAGEGWAPFNTDDGPSLLGWIDTVFCLLMP
jgi:OPA family glycerol-3-phosphate transporter-like MFS transporter 1/2